MQIISPPLCRQIDERADASALHQVAADVIRGGGVKMASWEKRGRSEDGSET